VEEFGGWGVAEDGDVDFVGSGAFVEEGAIDFGFGALEAALRPVAADQSINVELFERGLGVELAVVVGGEALPGGGVFGNDGGFGVHPVFERVEVGSVLALGRAGPVDFCALARGGAVVDRDVLFRD